MDFTEKAYRLADRLRDEQNDRRIRKYHWTAEMCSSRVPDIIMGRKYARLDIEHGHGHLMIEISTGKIYGIRSYGQVDKTKEYGTLDTIDDWYWGDFSPERNLMSVMSEPRTIPLGV
jgi:hypothetical protein